MTCLLVFPWIYNRQEECGWKNIHGRPLIGQFINTHASLNDFPGTKLDSLLLSNAISPEIHLIQQSSYRHLWMYWSQCSCPCTLTFRKFFLLDCSFVPIESDLVRKRSECSYTTFVSSYLFINFYRPLFSYVIYVDIFQRMLYSLYTYLPTCIVYI